VSETIDHLWLRQWVDVIKFNGPAGGPCLACEKPNSCKLYDHANYFACSYCGLTVTCELIFNMCVSPNHSYTSYTQAPPQPVGYFIAHIKHDWKRRKELVENAGVEFLVEVLNTKGFQVKLPKYESSYGLFQINEGSPKPKPWSYKGRAACEFNVRSDESGLV